MTAAVATGTALLISRELPSDVFRRALLETGYRSVDSVTTVGDALARLGRDGPRIELVMFELAALDHDPVAEVSRVARRLQGTPLVVVAGDELLGAVITAGATEVLARPVRTSEIIARLRHVRTLHERGTRQLARERRLGDAIRRLQDANRELERLVSVDALTGIANRRHSLALLDAECKRSLRDRVPLSVAMIDLDGFHEFNARYGHPGGDHCLQRVTAAMVQSLRRPSDFVGRYGGEELVAVLPNTAAAGAALVAERMRAAVENLAIPHVASPCAHVVTISVGVASQTRASCTAELLVASADSALLRAKKAGRNCVVSTATTSAGPPGEIKSRSYELLPGPDSRRALHGARDGSCRRGRP